MTPARGKLASKPLLPLLAIVGPNAAFPLGMAVGNRRAIPAAPLPAGVAAPAVDYRDDAVQAGLVQANAPGGADRKNYFVETTVTGVALVDCGKDGLLDFFVNSGRLAEKEPPPYRLYRNRTELRFEDVTAQVGLAALGRAGRGAPRASGRQVLRGLPPTSQGAARAGRATAGPRRRGPAAGGSASPAQALVAGQGLPSGGTAPGPAGAAPRAGSARAPRRGAGLPAPAA